MSLEGLEKAVIKLKKEIGPQIVGWSNKIREGKIRVYVSELPTSTRLVKSLTLEGRHYEVEYHRVGEIRVL